jgi:hypothetical protein
MQKKILHKKNYISLEFVNQIRSYYERINDSLLASRGPSPKPQSKFGYQGGWDRQLHYEKTDSPIHQVIAKLKEDFGDFSIYESSIRYLSLPGMPHTDVENSAWLKDYQTRGYRNGFTFLIPLWWNNSHTPATGFLNSPPNLDEPLYSDMLNILPTYAETHKEEARNFSVREIVKWESPGDLIAWENFQWHCSCHYGDVEYNTRTWVKEFILIKVWKYPS